MHFSMLFECSVHSIIFLLYNQVNYKYHAFQMIHSFNYVCNCD